MGSADIEVVELTPGSPWWGRGAFATLAELRPHLDEALLRQVLAGPDGPRFHGAVVGDRCQGVAGWRMVSNTAFGRCAYVDDLVVNPGARSTGIGGRLLAFVAAQATQLGATMLTLDSAVHRAGAHRFYHRERMHIMAFHFVRRLDPA